MAEELVMNVKSNIKSVTKETQDWGKTLDNVNESLSIQNKVITDLEKDLIKLKAKQDAIPKGAWVAGMDRLNDKIKKTSTELKLEKNALKDLTNQQKKASKEVKEFSTAQKGSNKETKDGIGNFRVMGVSLNGIKKGFSKVIPAAKAMFGTIKAGIMSTGIGALVIAVAALMQTFKRSEAGQEKFQRIMAAIGAVTSQVLDAFADLGEIIIDTFKDPLPAMKKFGEGLLKFLRDPTGATRDMFVKATLAYKDFNEETKKEVGALIEVANMRQKAHHIDRKLKVERAKANRDINDIRLKAEDREKKNATERIALLRKAQKIEEGITAKEIKSKQLLIDAQVLEMAQGHNTIKAKDKLAQLQAELINLDTKKLRSQRLLQTQITTAVNEEKAIKEQQIQDDLKNLEKLRSGQTEYADYLIKLAQKTADAQKVIDEQALADLKATEDAKAAIRDANIANIDAGISLVKSLAGESKEIMAAAIIAENASVIAKILMNTAEANAKAVAASPLTAGMPWVAINSISGGLGVAASIAAAAQGLSALGKGGATGGGGGAIPTASAQTPAPEMLSGAFTLGSGQAPEPMQAYVVSDDITNNQNKLAIIRRRATI